MVDPYQNIANIGGHEFTWAHSCKFNEKIPIIVYHVVGSHIHSSWIQQENVSEILQTFINCNILLNTRWLSLTYAMYLQQQVPIRLVVTLKFYLCIFIGISSSYYLMGNLFTQHVTHINCLVIHPFVAKNKTNKQKIQTRIRYKINGAFSFMSSKGVTHNLFRSLSITAWVNTSCLANYA
jgi:hypothetical protein